MERSIRKNMQTEKPEVLALGVAPPFPAACEIVVVSSLVLTVHPCNGINNSTKGAIAP